MKDHPYDEMGYHLDRLNKPRGGVTIRRRIHEDAATRCAHELKRVHSQLRLHPDDPRMHDEKGRPRFDKNCKYIVLIEWDPIFGFPFLLFFESSQFRNVII